MKALLLLLCLLLCPVTACHTLRDARLAAGINYWASDEALRQWVADQEREAHRAEAAARSR